MSTPTAKTDSYGLNKLSRLQGEDAAARAAAAATVLEPDFPYTALSIGLPFWQQCLTVGPLGFSSVSSGSAGSGGSASGSSDLGDLSGGFVGGGGSSGGGGAGGDF
jgi:uncharacterized membrane protein YgcG